ncbi:hypothetical protein ACTFIU_003357 [Dictyostelium citrinum]
MSEEKNDALVGEVNTDNADNQVWLIKVPKFLSESWQKIGQGEIGQIHIKGGDNISLSYGPDVGQEFQLITTANTLDNQPLKIFSEDKDGALALEGNIGLRCDIKIDVESPQYRDLMKSRHTKYNTKTRMTQVIDETELITPIIFDANKVKVSTVGITQKKKSTDKKEKLPEDEVLDLIFSAFRAEKHLDLKTLETFTEQPKNHLKTILEKVCILNKRGPYHHLYELKPEFRDKDNSKDEKK